MVNIGIPLFISIKRVNLAKVLFLINEFETIIRHSIMYMGVWISLQLSQKIDFAKGILRKCRI